MLQCALMTTHRSLNKLEFKAHMSIHNMKEVEEGEAHDLNATRDRFGKKHQLSEPTGESRLTRRKKRAGKAALALLWASFFCGAAAASDEALPREDASMTHATERRNTDIKV